MLEQEDIVESANTHLRNCFVFFFKPVMVVYGLVMISFISHLQRMKKWNYPQIGLGDITDLIIVSVKFFFVSYLSQYSYQSLFLICYGASYCFTVPHNQGLWLTGPPLNGNHLLAFNVCVIYAKAY